jgi:hypothetical protein
LGKARTFRTTGAPAMSGTPSDTSRFAGSGVSTSNTHSYDAAPVLAATSHFRESFAARVVLTANDLRYSFDSPPNPPADAFRTTRTFCPYRTDSSSQVCVRKALALGVYFSNENVFLATGAGCVLAETAQDASPLRGSASWTSTANAAPAFMLASMTTSPKLTPPSARGGVRVTLLGRRGGWKGQLR